MWLLPQRHNNIPRIKLKPLLRLPFKHNLIPINHPLFNLKIQIPRFHSNFLPPTNRTHMCLWFSRTFTFIAFHLDLFLFIFYLNCADHFTCTVTMFTRMKFSALISCAFAFFADFSSPKTESQGSPSIELGKWDRHLGSIVSSFRFRMFLDLGQTLLTEQIVGVALRDIN